MRGFLGQWGPTGAASAACREAGVSRVLYTSHGMLQWHMFTQGAQDDRLLPSLALDAYLVHANAYLMGFPLLRCRFLPDKYAPLLHCILRNKSGAAYWVLSYAVRPVLTGCFCVGSNSAADACAYRLGAADLHCAPA